MKINILYVVAGDTPGAPPGVLYRPGFDRFVRTFNENTPPVDYCNVILINSHGGLTQEMRDQVPFAFKEMVYSGNGWDIGAQQGAAELLSPNDWVICFSSWAYFTQPGWLERYRWAIVSGNDSLYGSMSSMENGPHLRGTGYCCNAKSFCEYPNKAMTREQSFTVESGPGSLTAWFQAERGGAYLLTWDGIYGLPLIREPSNIFRRGDQSNLINRDKHSMIYDVASPEERKRLEHLADTGIDTNTIK